LISIQTGLHVPPIVESPSPQSSADWSGLWADESATLGFAQRLAACPAILNATLTLHGDLGAGKTTLVRHLLRALGVPGRIKSPTYAVVEPHTSHACPLLPAGEALSIWHFDFYRFTDPREWEDAGFRELFASPGLKLVEWPERAGDTLERVDLRLHIEPLESQASPDPHPPPHGMPTDLTDLDKPTPRRVRAQALTGIGQSLVAALPR